MCTAIKLTATNGDIFFGRTMDLALPMFGEDAGMVLPGKIINIPANVEVPSQFRNWQAKYAMVGMAADQSAFIYDGINEHGLAGDTQVLMECTWKDEADFEGTDLTPVLGEEFVGYILTNYQSVADIKANISQLALIKYALDYQGQSINYPLHYVFTDPTGAGVVLEAVHNGEFKVYDFADVMTNSPEYDYHLNNIRNYIGMTNIDHPDDRQINDKTLHPIEGGTGYGLFGIPGDYTSPSRFVRSFIYSNLMDKFDTQDGIAQLYAAFRPVIIPRGLEHKTPTTQLSDFTRYWAGYDLTNKTLYVQSGRALAFTSKTLDPTLDHITYEEIDLTNHVHSLN
ncbi:linear amide C-N hydrolase [Periweissella ghanensis]|uniref:Choloylglycine hydrolase/NAAA C-terminal domain-containing protein n=1 Tax=Periweissella ghanensis TaxID=467997 RepID=A0ABN8BP67_9LACO|nr:linear amide C-N hydrolase [Periweissella ghanensis]MCM0601717.1 linear amide C-N hydrolase [Periweissella ghanensis]CAH0418405.1 putative protein YxeI [Periweissella ghanensis]